MGAVLSTFNSVLNSAATIFSIDLYKGYFNPKSSDKRLVQVGKITSTILAVFAILVAPWVANAPDGLYQLLQQLNGIFFIPIASIMIAGFFTKNISAIAAKTALGVGLSFYLICTFIYPVNIHFVHIWGIEFILNMGVMYGVSYFYPRADIAETSIPPLLDLKSWKYTNHLSITLCVITLLIYISLGTWN
jgi:SSS family solute:Na+ symporter